MALALRGQTNSSEGATTSHTITKPTGVVAGDVVLVHVLFKGDPGAITNVAGGGTGAVWTVSPTQRPGTDAQRSAFFRCIAGSTPTDLTFTTANSIATQFNSVAISGTNARVVDIQVVTDGTRDFASDIPAATAYSVNDVDLWFSANYDGAAGGTDSWTTPSGYSVITKVNDTGNGYFAGGFYKIGSLGGTSLSATTFANSHSDSNVGWRVVVAEVPTVDITGDDFVDGTTTVAYSDTVTMTSSGYGSLTFSVTAGALPDGLSLTAATGVVSGTPTVAGTFNFTITATDSISQSDSQAFTVEIFLLPSGGIAGWMAATM